MAFFLVIILLLLGWCGAKNHLKCQLFDENSKLFEKYCENFSGLLPKNCPNAIENQTMFIQLSDRIQLKIGGCDQNFVIDDVLSTINVSIFDISYSGYRSLDWAKDLKLDHLMKFNASHNEVDRIWEPFLSNASDVTELDLSYNKLMSLHSSIFEGNGKLVKIHLSNNRLSIHDVNGIFGRLKYIDLRGNRLREIPQLFRFPKLKDMRLERNQIEQLNCRFSFQNVNLKSISMCFSWTNLRSIELCQGYRLNIVQNVKHKGLFVNSEGKYELHCNEQQIFKGLNRIKAPQNTFANVWDLINLVNASKIWEIDLSANHIGKLNHSTLEGFKNLQFFYLNDANLTEFNFDAIKSPQKLWWLDISNNNLKYLNNISLLANFTALYRFNIAGNRLENTPEIIQHLNSTAIERLNLAGNFLGKLNATTFQRFTELEVLHLNATDLAFSDENPFEALEHLEVLDISQNNLENANFTILTTTLNRLRYFYASHCRIKNISEIIELLGRSLKGLDLSGNVIGTLNAQLFKQFDYLQVLNLRNAHILNIDCSDFDVAESRPPLSILDLSHNQLQEIDQEFLSKGLVSINLEGNKLTKFNFNFTQQRFGDLDSLAISNNQFQCAFLEKFIPQHKKRGLRFNGDPWKQKHGECN